MGRRKSKMGVPRPPHLNSEFRPLRHRASVSITVALPALGGLIPKESTAWPFQRVSVKMVWKHPPPVQIRGGCGDRHVTTSTDQQGPLPRSYPGGLWAY